MIDGIYVTISNVFFFKAANGDGIYDLVNLFLLYIYSCARKGDFETSVFPSAFLLSFADLF